MRCFWLRLLLLLLLFKHGAKSSIAQEEHLTGDEASRTERDHAEFARP